TVTLVDLRAEADPALRARIKAQGIELIAGMAVTDAAGRKGVSRVTIGPPGGDGDTTRECDVVCMSDNWSPVVHLTSHTGIKPRFREDIAAFVPGGLAAGHFAAGAVTGEFGLAAAIRAGASAGHEAAALAGHAGAAIELPVPDGGMEGYAIAPSWEIAGRRGAPAFVDFQNDVTAKDVHIAHREGYESVEHLKRYTTLGMGTDQGKTSNINALAIMAGLRQIPISDAGTTTFRPPYSPVAL